VFETEILQDRNKPCPSRAPFRATTNGKF
jgi:hypothetical protein